MDNVGKGTELDKIRYSVSVINSRITYIQEKLEQKQSLQQQQNKDQSFISQLQEQQNPRNNNVPNQVVNPNEIGNNFL